MSGSSARQAESCSHSVSRPAGGGERFRLFTQAFQRAIEPAHDRTLVLGQNHQRRSASAAPAMARRGQIDGPGLAERQPPPAW